jgi:hypothetical protein
MAPPPAATSLIRRVGPAAYGPGDIGLASPRGRPDQGRERDRRANRRRSRCHDPGAIGRASPHGRPIRCLESRPPCASSCGRPRGRLPATAAPRFDEAGAGLCERNRPRSSSAWPAAIQPTRGGPPRGPAEGRSGCVPRGRQSGTERCTRPPTRQEIGDCLVDHRDQALPGKRLHVPSAPARPRLHRRGCRCHVVLAIRPPYRPGSRRGRSSRACPARHR